MMRKPLLTMLAASLLTLTSCDLEMSSNGMLDGYWQLQRVDTLATGGSCDLREELRFWAVEVRLLQTSDQSYRLPTCLLRFEQRGDSLYLHDPYLKHQGDADERVTDAEVLQPYGIGRLEERYLIERLDGKAMRLSNDELRLYFARY